MRIAAVPYDELRRALADAAWPYGGDRPWRFCWGWDGYVPRVYRRRQWEALTALAVTVVACLRLREEGRA